MSGYSPVKPIRLMLLTLAVMLLAAGVSPACAEQEARGGIVMAPEGGRLDALDEQGQLIGPCPLEHTDVQVHISGHFTRVDVTQRYRNPYEHKIEAVYTFPLSHRGAVDRMTMTIGDRIIEGEVRQRDIARRIYEGARRQGYVAALLEQERPNIFTQSVANIEPDAEVEIRISYIEVLESVDGQYHFHFPTVVAPRYTPGRPLTDMGQLPDGVRARPGLVMAAPAEITTERGGEIAGLTSDWLHQHTIPIHADSPIVEPRKRAARDARVQFRAAFDDGAVERGMVFEDGVGFVGDNWFFCPPRLLPAPGEPFAVDTDQVPDASRVTPMPVKPDQRAGHDINIRVHIDTGGPGITDIDSSSHGIEHEVNAEQPRRATVRLRNEREIPNRDFRLTWELTSEGIEEAILTHTGDEDAYRDFAGGFFTLILQPPARVADEDVRPRELIFVLDNSGSMLGARARLADRSALDAAKDVISKAIHTMRPDDRFNIISFNHTLAALWEQPRANTAANRASAQQFIDRRQGGGGTEMRNAVLRALGAGPFEAHRPRPDEDGKQPMRIVLFVTDGLVSNDAAIIRAVRDHAHETRVFTIGMSQAPNRHLLDEMARVGRGAVDYALPYDDVDPIVQRFADRIATPVLTDIDLSFEGIEVTDVLPSPEHMPDLFDFEPLVIHGRYSKPGEGTLTIRGRTGGGPYERRLDLTLPEHQPQHDTIATLWARRKVGELMREGDDEEAIIKLGESFQIVTQHTSFIAVDRHRVTLGGNPVLVRIPIEFPEGMSWEGIFGDTGLRGLDEREVAERAFQRHRLDAAAPDFVGGWVGVEEPLPAAPRRPQAEMRPRVRELPDQARVRDAFGMAAPAVRPVPERAEAASPRPAMQPPPADRPPQAAERQDGRVVFMYREQHAEPRATRGRQLLRVPAGPVPGAPEGVTVEVVALSSAAEDRVIERLNALLGFDPEAAAQAPPAFGRAVRDREDDLLVVTVSPIAEILEPFAARLDEKDADRAAVLDEMFEALERGIATVRRDFTLHRVLDESLHRQVMALREKPDAAAATARHRVTVLLWNLDDDTLSALANLGFEHEATAQEASFLVGRIDAGRLEALALHEAVRRIEPLR